MPDLMKERIAKSVFWMGWSKGVVQVCAFLSTVLVARLLDPSDFGLIALTGIWIGSLTLLAEMGLGAIIVQFRDLDDRELNCCFWIAFGASLVGYGLLNAAAPMIAWWFGTPMLTEVLRVVSLTLPLTGLRIVPDSLLRKSLALDRVSGRHTGAGGSCVRGSRRMGPCSGYGDDAAAAGTRYVFFHRLAAWSEAGE